ncbi:hypothetical protein SeMB42_g07268 [Synchytrium endobioticum]|uniref:tRNA-splicing endonuclease subunit Sen15 domain-containing protein n=1 Tax=Synchytrium endobioticum TaxID=286115 RepID=A0A507CB74_9FUNG|nr:hypothetical protein SeMB42_g07268 [Synchytrium endobioticum]TPX40895.1 hypothetical protein SeLEV6574_g06357 [Synchytrium endobioticum]
MESHPNYKDLAKELHGMSGFHQELAFQVYVDLKFAKKWATIQAQRISKWNRVVFWSSMDAIEPQDVLIPTPVSERWTINSLEEYFKVLKFPVDGRTPTSVVLAVIETDSNVSYYRVHRDLVKPPEPKSK